MKFSKAILKGYMQNGGRQCVGRLIDDEGRMCVMGAAALAISGDALQLDGIWDGYNAFRAAWGIDPVSINNNDGGTEPHPWEDIYGMAVAAGL